MTEEYVNLLEYLKSECEREYKLLTITDTVETLNLAYFNYEPISEEKFRLMIRELYNGDYIDLKYLDDEVALIKPLARGFTVKKEVQEARVQEKAPQKKKGAEWFFYLLSFACSFLGALLGGIIC